MIIDDIDIMRTGMKGLIVGDALGGPVQFMDREKVKERPITEMRRVAPFGLPLGSWSDDSSMALATLDSIYTENGIDPGKIMDNFVKWFAFGEYTPFDASFDIGVTCLTAINAYMHTGDIDTCGKIDETSNGNGSIMRILPASVFCVCEKLDEDEAISLIGQVSGLTHNHLRSKIGCGIHFFITRELISKETRSLKECVQAGIDKAWEYYINRKECGEEIGHYNRLKIIENFAALPEAEISSSGYVVHTLEAALWSLCNTSSYKEGLLKAVNLGHDADSVGAVAGGLAALYYGEKAIPKEWWNVIQRRELIEDICSMNYS